MRSRDLLVFLLLAPAGCGSTGAPRGYLPGPAAAASDPWGGWVELRGMAGSGLDVIEGELIAVDAEKAWVLPAHVSRAAGVVWEDSVVAVPWSGVERIRATLYEADTGPLKVWGAVGSVSAISHGYGMVFSIPIWIGVTASACRSEVAEGMIRAKAPGTSASERTWVPLPAEPYPPLARLRCAARFPQGLPAGIVRLRPRPGPPKERSVTRTVPATRSTPR